MVGRDLGRKRPPRHEGGSGAVLVHDLNIGTDCQCQILAQVLAIGTGVRGAVGAAGGGSPIRSLESRIP